MSAMTPLPIDALLPRVVAAVRTRGALVIEAPPGAGKTTRVPRALLEAGLAERGEIVVLEPRRLPTRLSARRVAEELGEEVGGTVGYAVRFEDVSSSRTRLRFVTEGILARRLLAEPTLPGVAAVVLDEIHERHLQTDLALALLARLRREARPDLAVVAMSATLEAAPLAAFLGAEALRSEGRAFPLRIEHEERPDERPLHEKVAGALKRALREVPDGDVLVFLPGAAEIRRAGEAIAPFAAEHGLLVLPLHGDLPLDEQSRVVRPAPGRRKVILSTNVAETSVTIEGVAVVIDSGLARQAGHSPWSGLPTLSLAKVSRAAAAQRAGRAGRTRAGVVYRLYGRHDHDGRPERETPEIARLDLAELLLTLHGAGVREVRSFPFFEAPPAAALEAAETLLGRLGALADGALTEIGRRMVTLPVHPRLGRLLVEGEARGLGREAALLAALAAERDIRRETRTDFGRGGPRASRGGGPSDLLELAERFGEAERSRFAPGRLSSLGLDARAVEAVDRARRQLARGLRGGPPPPATPALRDEALLRATLAAFPDRVARRRKADGRELVLAEGGSAQLSESSVLHDAEWMVAVDVEERAVGKGAARTTVRLASQLAPEWLLDLAPDAVVELDELVWNEPARRVDRVSRLAFGQVALSEDVRPATPSPEVAKVLAREAKARGALASPGVARLAARLELLARHAPDAALPVPGESELLAALAEACEGLRSLAELEEVPVEERLVARLSPAEQQRLRTLAPERVQLPGGRSIEIQYEAGKGPWIESRLQDFFGMASTPTVAAGRVPLTLHLNAPSGRAVQVTQDLAGFWQRHYPQLRKELMRRYPKHAWPEDGATARPPPPGRLR